MGDYKNQYVPEAEDVPAEQGTEGDAQMQTLGEQAHNAFQRPGPFAMPAPQLQAPWHTGKNLGAIGGKEVWDNFTSRAPAAAEAGESLAQAQEQEGNQLAEQYQKNANEIRGRMAAIESRRQEDMAGERQRVEEIKQRTAEYTADLQDQGKFWRNPGNVISAIAYAFLPMGGNGGMSGINMINRAVEADFAQRKALADGHLGALKSNLEDYRKMMGNQQAGDQLALSESYRVAAMDIQRIGAQFQGQKAAAQTRMATQEMLMKADHLAMQAFNAYVYMPPAQRPTGMVKALKATGPQNYEDFKAQAIEQGKEVAKRVYAETGDPKAAVEAGKTHVQEALAAGPGAQETPAGGAGGAKPFAAGKVKPEDMAAYFDTSRPPAPVPSQAPAGVGSNKAMRKAGAEESPMGLASHGLEDAIGPQGKALLEKRFPGSTVVQQSARAYALDRAYKEAVSDWQSDPKKLALLRTQDGQFMLKNDVLKRVYAIDNEAEKQVQGILDSKGKEFRETAGSIKLWGKISHYADYIDRKFGGDEKKIQEWLGDLRGINADNVGEELQTLNAKWGLNSPVTQNEINAALVFKSLYQQGANQYYKTVAGGAVSEGEEARLAKVFTNKSWARLKSSIEMMRDTAQTDWTTLRASAGGPVNQALLDTRLGVTNWYRQSSRPGRSTAPSAENTYTRPKR